MMKLEDYITEVRRTTSNESATRRQINYVFGLTEEAGEVSGWHKKTMFHHRDLGKDELVEELGDVAWYLFALMDAHDINPMEVFQVNADKLRKRYPGGFVRGGGVRD